MPENVSHVVVHHYYDNGSGTHLLNMTCCIVLSVVIILILLIICVVAICMIFQRSKRNHQKAAAPAILPQTSVNLPPTFANFPQTLPGGVRRVTTKTYNRNICRGISNPAASFEDNDMDINSNRHQNIPMSTFKTNVDDIQADSSESSAGLCEVLFPQEHECEVIYETLPKVAFSERVYSTSRRNSRPAAEPRPSEPGTSQQNSNNSMEWDYLESRQYGTSNDSETDRRDTVDVCWV